MNLKGPFLGIAADHNVENLAIRMMDEINALRPVSYWRSVNRKNHVSRFQPSAVRWLSAQNLSEDCRYGRITKWLLRGAKTRGADFHGLLGALVLDEEPHHAAGRSLLQESAYFGPRGCRSVINRHDSVAIADTRFGKRAPLWQIGQHDGLVEVCWIWISPDGEKSAQQNNRHDEVDHRTGQGDERALPARLAHQLVGGARGFLVASVDVAEVLARHAHVAAKGKRADAVVCGAALPAKQPRAKADGKNVHPYFKQARDDEVPPLMD